MNNNTNTSETCVLEEKKYKNPKELIQTLPKCWRKWVVGMFVLIQLLTISLIVVIVVYETSDSSEDPIATRNYKAIFDSNGAEFQETVWDTRVSGSPKKITSEQLSEMKTEESVTTISTKWETKKPVISFDVINLENTYVIPSSDDRKVIDKKETNLKKEFSSNPNLYVYFIFENADWGSEYFPSEYTKDVKTTDEKEVNDKEISLYICENVNSRDKDDCDMISGHKISFKYSYFFRLDPEDKSSSAKEYLTLKIADFKVTYNTENVRLQDSTTSYRAVNKHEYDTRLFTPASVRETNF